jgi:glycosyltransferase involved in cell wall biosynthesis
MRIGIDARMIDNTGIGRYLRNLLIHLAQIDGDNEYVVFINPNNSRVVTQENFRFVPLTIPVPLYSLREQYWLPLEIRKWNLDFMHYPNFDIPLIRSYPSIVTIHDLIYYLYPDQCPSKVAHYYARFMLRHTTKHARATITDSEYSKQDLINYFHVPDEKIHVILPAADGKCSSHSKEHTHTNIEEKYGILQPYILYVGKHHPYKNINTLLHAYNKYSDIYEQFQLVIAGKRDERRKNLYTTAKNLDSGKSIVFTDFVPEEELFELYQRARLFVFPSLYEGFGLPPLEAMACGVPVITSNAASLPEVVGDAAIQVDPLNVHQLADAIQTVLTNTQLWNTLKQKGIKRSRQFSWGTAARQLLQVYENLI